MKGCFFVELRFYNGILWFPRGIYHPKGCLEFMLKILEFTLTYIIYTALTAAFAATMNLRKNSYEIFSFFCKTNPIFALLSPKTMMSLKNKPNTNPIQTRFKPKQTQFKPIAPFHQQCNLLHSGSILITYMIRFLRIANHKERRWRNVKMGFCYTFNFNNFYSPGG